MKSEAEGKTDNRRQTEKIKRGAEERQRRGEGGSEEAEEKERQEEAAEAFSKNMHFNSIDAAVCCGSVLLTFELLCSRPPNT
jgi:hypothetical protein